MFENGNSTKQSFDPFDIALNETAEIKDEIELIKKDVRDIKLFILFVDDKLRKLDEIHRAYILIKAIFSFVVFEVIQTIVKMFQ